MIKLNIRWMGDEDCDRELVAISVRYWSADTRFSTIDKDGDLVNFLNVDGASIRPLARCSLIIYNAGELTELASERFEGDTFEEVIGQVEVWAGAIAQKAVDVLIAAFDVTP